MSDTFHSDVTFPCTIKLYEALEASRKNRRYYQPVILAKDGLYDICPTMKNHSLHPDHVFIEYSCGNWCFV